MPSFGVRSSKTSGLSTVVVDIDPRKQQLQKQQVSLSSSPPKPQYLEAVAQAPPPQHAHSSVSASSSSLYGSATTTGTQQQQHSYQQQQPQAYDTEHYPNQSLVGYTEGEEPLPAVQLYPETSSHTSHSNPQPHIRTVTMRNPPSLSDDHNDNRYHNDDEEEEDPTTSNHHNDKKAEDNFEKTVSGLGGMKKAVQYSRIAVLFILLASAVGLAILIYVLTKESEQDQFQLQYEQHAHKVIDHFATEWEFTLGAVDAFVLTSVTTAAVTNQSYPFVTQPAFAVRAAKLRTLTAALVVSTYPLVTTEQRPEWESFSVTHDDWVQQAVQVQQDDINFLGVTTFSENLFVEGSIHGNEGFHYGAGPYLPTWETYPMVPLYSSYNWDIRLHYPDEINTVLTTKQAVLGKTDNLPSSGLLEDFDQATVQWARGYSGPMENPAEPLAIVYYPMLQPPNFQEDDIPNLRVQVNNVTEYDSVGVFVLTLYWRALFLDILPPGSNGIVVVISNTCGQAFTFKLYGPDVVYLGGRDLHDPSYDADVLRLSLPHVGDFSSHGGVYNGVPMSKEFCPYTLSVYPSDDMKNDYMSNDPVIFAVIAVSIFLFTSLIFMVYDHFTRTRQRRILQTALKNSNVVSSMFPHSIRDRVLSHRSTGGAPPSAADGSMQGRLQSFLRSNFSVRTDTESASGPIAEYFEEATVMFADIANFTAWSSVREPGQVFSLLENIYGAFDSVAKRRGAYKVETIGDSYVAVAGVPNPCPDHAVVMVRFAKDCRQMMSYLTRDLEITLGPGTGDLQMRFGLNSGPVIAGVLRGARSRFQLFGDTVNTAACMEATGCVNKIHISQSTADLLIANGKQHWVTRRREPIEAKGKGSMQTYWVDPKYSEYMDVDEDDLSRSSSSSSSLEEHEEGSEDNKTDRLVDWNVDILGRLLRQVVANRDTQSTNKRVSLKAPHYKFEVDGGSIVDEFADVIEFKQPTSTPAAPDAVEIPEHVTNQLRTFVKKVASLYEEHDYHNFEHSCHVSMSLVKLVSRVVGPDEDPSSPDKNYFGLCSDPLAQFACVFAALVHHVKHPGVSNSQLIAEGSALAQSFEFRSVSEQNAVQVAWELLNDDAFPDLRRAICATQAEVKRFRQLLVNLVLATDTLDIDMRYARDSRWERVFGDVDTSGCDDEYSQRATVLAEVLVQAADIGHTMQHWHIYRKWNEQFFEEMYVAHAKGRGDINPAEYWYDAELAFFDDCVLPLARKFKDARIFGVSSEEHYNYAQRNREEWEDKGREVVKYMAEKIRAKFRSRDRSRSARMASIAE